MKKDRDGNALKVGDVCFYTERPHSNYADSLIEVYEHEGVLKVGTLVVNGLSGRCYIECGRDTKNDLELDVYSWDVLARPTEVFDSLQLIPDLKAEDVSINMANERFPL